MPAEITAQDFRSQFPEFADIADDVAMRLLNEALHIHSARKLATLFCAAHLHKLNQDMAAGNEAGGEKSAARVGSLSVSYMTQAETGRESFFTTTEYGKRFLTLEKRNARTGIGAMVV